MIRQQSLRRPRQEFRRGTAIVFSLIALLVASLLIAALVRMTGLAHRQMLSEELRIQANLIADSACERGLAAMRRDPGFQDEVWLIPATQLGNNRQASVQIHVENDPAAPEKKFLTVLAEYPLNHPHIVRVRRRVSAS